MNEQPTAIFAVTIKYSSDFAYPAAAFPTKELAEAYVRYNHNLPGLSPVTMEITEFNYYNIDFEWAYKLNEEARNKSESGV